ncbi:MAG: SIS domain-containing protein [Balneolaceae bacterium]|nr:SIS domain-containing protein [Balneolaceae bacterium]
MTKKNLGYTNENLETLGGAYTAREIAGQPGLWQKTWQKVASEKKDLQKFLDSALSLTGLSIVLTGAGTSAFIGEVAEPLLNRYWPRPVRALPTTTLVTHFEEYIETDRPLLLISFARSGNSPESTATVRLAEEHCARSGISSGDNL